MPQKINKQELEALRRMNNLVNEHLVIADALNKTVKMEIRKLLNEKGYSMEENYNINLENGKVEKQKSEPTPPIAKNIKK